MGLMENFHRKAPYFMGNRWFPVRIFPNKPIPWLWQNNPIFWWLDELVYHPRSAAFLSWHGQMVKGKPGRNHGWLTILKSALRFLYGWFPSREKMNMYGWLHTINKPSIMQWAVFGCIALVQLKKMIAMGIVAQWTSMLGHLKRGRCNSPVWSINISSSMSF